MSAPELKPCPFCGGEASLILDPGHSTGWYVACHNDACDINPSVWAVHQDTAEMQWNTRATDASLAELRAERDRFEAALGRACLVGGTTYMVEQCAAMQSRLAAAEAMAAAIDRAIAEAVADDLDPWFAGMKAARAKWEAGK